MLKKPDEFRSRAYVVGVHRLLLVYTGKLYGVSNCKLNQQPLPNVENERVALGDQKVTSESNV